MIYLDNAATTFPKPQCVVNSVCGAMSVYGANPGRSGYPMAIKTGEQIYNCRKLAAELFGAESPERIVFTSGCTESLNLAIKGIMKKGGHAVVSDLEHNAVMRVVHKLSRQNIITFTCAHVHHGDDEATLSEFKKALRPNTCAIICTHASNVFGTLLPIKEIGELAKEHGCLFIVDAAQTAGTVPINVKEMNIDYLCMPCHKGLYGTMGSGILVFGGEEKAEIETLIEGGTGSSSMNYLQPDFLPDRFESGTPNVPGIIAAAEGMKFVKKLGEERICAHELKLIKKLYTAFEKRENILLYTPAPQKGESVPLLSFNIKGLGSEKTAELLAENGICVRAGLHCAPSAHKSHSTDGTGTVRVCPSAFTTEKEIDYLINCADKIANS